MSDLNVSNSTVYIYADPSQTDGLDWQPDDPNASIVDNNYGTFTADDVAISDDQIVVTTSSGTLTFSGPELDEASKDFSDYDYGATAQNLNEQAPSIEQMMAEMTALMLTINLELSKSDRIERQSARETALQQAESAGEKLMANALTNLIMGCVAGAISVVGGLVSGFMQFKGATELGEGFEDVGASKLRSKLTGTEEELAETNLEIAQTKQEISDLDAQAGDEGLTSDQLEQKEALQNHLDELTEKAETLQQRRDDQLDKLSELTEKTETTLDSAKEDRDAKQEKLDELKEAEEPDTKKIDAAQKKLTQAQDKCNKLQERLDRLQGLKKQSDALGDMDPPEDDGDVSDETIKTLTEVRDRAHMNHADAEVGLKQSWDRFNMLLSKIQMNSNRWEGVRSLGQGVGGVFTSAGGYAQSQGEKEKGIEDAHSQQSASYRDQFNSDFNRDDDQIQQALQLFNSMVDTQAQARHDVWV